MSALITAPIAVGAYAYFFWSLPLAATAFMINAGQLFPAVAPYFDYSIDHNPKLSDDFNTRLLINVGLLGLFAIPHSIFARPAVKSAFSRFGKMYRSLYVLKSAACLHLLIKYWQPLDDTVVWDCNPTFCLAVYGIGWVWLVTSTFTIDHFELFGITDGLGLDLDIMSVLGGKKAGGFIERGHYTLCRHPIMLGFFIMFFGVPTMTYTHLFFSVACSAYILLAVSFLEEPDLVASMGDAYKDYKTRVPMYCPFGFGGGSKSAKAEQ